MQLYIGGYAQGKLAYVQEKLKGHFFCDMSRFR